MVGKMSKYDQDIFAIIPFYPLVSETLNDARFALYIETLPRPRIYTSLAPLNIFTSKSESIWLSVDEGEDIFERYFSDS